MADPQLLQLGWEAKVDLGINAHVFPFGVRNISVDRSADEHECGDTEDGEFKRSAGGRRQIRITMQIFEDGTISYFSLGGRYGLVEGKYRFIMYYPRGRAGFFYNFTNALLTQVRHASDVNNPNDISITFVSTEVPLAYPNAPLGVG